MYVFINLWGALFSLLGSPKEQGCLSALAGWCCGCSFAILTPFGFKVGIQGCAWGNFIFFSPISSMEGLLFLGKMVQAGQKVVRGQQSSVVLCFSFWAEHEWSPHLEKGSRFATEEECKGILPQPWRWKISSAFPSILVSMNTLALNGEKENPSIVNNWP